MRAFAALLVACSVAQNAQTAQTAPAQLVEAFYHWYIAAVEKQQDPFTDDRQTLRTYVSAPLVASLTRKRNSPDGLDADYFLQAQDYQDEWQSRIAVLMVSQKERSAIASVTLGGSAASPYRLEVQLRKFPAGWRITGVKRWADPIIR